MATRATRDAYKTAPTFDAMLKRFYDDEVFPQFATWFPCMSWLKEEGRIKRIKPQGEKIYFGVELYTGSGAGPAGEGDTIATADSVTSVQGNVDYNRGFKGRIALTAEALKFAKTGKGALNDALKQETRGMVTAIKQEANPHFLGHGEGSLAKTTTQVVATTSVVPVSSELSTGMWPGTRWLREGGRLGCHTGTSYTDDATWAHTTTADKIVEIASDVLFKTGAANGTAAATRYFISKTGYTTAVAGSQRNPAGLLAMCDDGQLTSSYCGLSETTYPQWKGVVSDDSGAGRALTLMMLYRHYNKMGRKAGSINPKVKGWTNPDMLMELVDLLEHYVEFNAQKLLGGFKDVEVAVHGYPLRFRLDFAFPGVFAFFDPEKITVAEGCPLEIVDEDGLTMRKIADKDAFEMQWRWIIQTYTKKRNAHGMLADINYTVGSV